MLEAQVKSSLIFIKCWIGLYFLPSKLQKLKESTVENIYLEDVIFTIPSTNYIKFSVKQTKVLLSKQIYL